MSFSSYLVIHRDHEFDPLAINSGAEMATLFLCRELSRQGHRVVLAGQFPKEVPPQSGIEFWNLGADFDLKAIFKRAESLGQYHLISAGRAAPLLTSIGEALCQSRSLISHDRSSNDTGLNARVLARIADNIFCVSEAQKEFFLKDGVPEEKLTVIHNGVDLEIFKASPAPARDPKKLIFAGALVVDKGLHLLLEAYSQLKQKHPGLTLDVYGSSDLWRRGDYLNQAEIERTLPGVKFMGKVDQKTLAAAIGRAGICVVPSIWFDPFPLVSIDAQATGCPVVAFDVGGVKEGIFENQTGLVIREISAEALSKSLDGILSDENRWRIFCDNALRLSRPRFTWDKLVSTVVQKSTSAKRSVKTAVFSTWNQQCGLATYAKFLFSKFDPSEYFVLAEETADLTGKDESNVFRCWSKKELNVNKIKELVRSQKAEILFLNFHTHFKLLPQPAFNTLLNELRAEGIKVIAHLHNTFTLDPAMREFLKCADEVICLGPENRLEAIANGASPEKTSFIPHGVHIPEGLNRDDVRAKLGIPRDQRAVSCFGFVQPHKGMEELIDSIARLRAKGVEAHGYILGSVNPGDPNSPRYLEYLKNLTVELNVNDRIHFSGRFLKDGEVSEYLVASDLVVMNYKSQHYEASGACSLAVGSGAVVAASLAPPFVPFKDAVWHINAGYDTATSIELLLTDQHLRAELQKRADLYRRQFSWERIACILKERFYEIAQGPGVPCPKTSAQNSTAKSAAIKSAVKPLRVLMQNRSNTFTQRGGDTILIEKTIQGLEKRGVSVKLDLEGSEDPKNYDLVHLFNFVLSDMVKYYAEKAYNANVPYVVTTLNEEISRFHNPSVTVAQSLINYVAGGQNRGWYETHRVRPESVPACADFDNTWAAWHAAALIANGHEEAAGLKRIYQGISNIRIVPVGYDIGAEGDAEDFRREFGVSDFVLCVGRLESRKNQLMLLKALEDSDIPVVLAGGGFTYQPEYAAAARNFKRRGKTLVLDKLSPHMLASAYRAARVHALPSWYELPGLVSLEAAYYGCNVVVTDYGTARSYFEDEAFYCEPGSEHSILSAVLAAYESPQKTGLKEVSMKYTWDKASEKTLETYNTVLGRGDAPHNGVINNGASMQYENTNIQVFDLDSDAARFQEMLERGEMAAKEKDLARADKYLSEAELINPSSVRLLRAKGAVMLAMGEVTKAKEYFEKGIKFDAGNARLYSGLGMCEMQLKNSANAYGLFLKALELAPFELVAILQLLECSYALNKYDDLEKVLRAYLEAHPQDLQMRYCLAGCLFKQSKLDEASRLADEVLAADANNLGAKQLKSAIADLNKPQASEAASPAREEAVFDSIDRAIVEIEELKRTRNYKEVLQKSRERLEVTTLRDDQREKLELLQSEAEVLQGEIVSAEARYNRILNKNPNSARAMCGKGAIAANRGDWQTAKDYFERAHQLEPNYDVAWAGLGVYNLSISDKEQAWECFTKAITLNPENIRALLGIIELGYVLNRLDEVERVIKLYLDMHPLDLNFLYSLAGCYFAQDRLEEAMAEVQKICMFEPENKNALELRELIISKQATVRQAANP